MSTVSKQLGKVTTFPILQMKKLGVAQDFLGLRVMYPGFEHGLCFVRVSSVIKHSRGPTLRPSSPAAWPFLTLRGVVLCLPTH